MKKFLTSLIIGVTMMAIGVTMLMFEIKDFEVIQEVSESSDRNQVTFSANDVHRIIIDGYQGYEWKIDEDLKNEIQIIFPSNLQVNKHQHRIYIEGESMDELEEMNLFLEGLKDKKIYSNVAMEDVVIVSSSETMDAIEVYYED